MAAAQGRSTSPLCGGETRAGGDLVHHAIFGLTEPSGGNLVTGSRAPPLACHCGGAAVAQGGLHRGLAVCKGAPGLPVAQPFPGLLLLSLLPNPLHSVSVHRCIMGRGPNTRNGTLCNARPGLGLSGKQAETAARQGKGHLPLGCSLRQGVGTYQRPSSQVPHELRGCPPSYRRM